MATLEETAQEAGEVNGLKAMWKVWSLAFSVTSRQWTL